MNLSEAILLTCKMGILVPTSELMKLKGDNVSQVTVQSNT